MIVFDGIENGTYNQNSKPLLSGPGAGEASCIWEQISVFWKETRDRWTHSLVECLCETIWWKWGKKFVELVANYIGDYVILIVETMIAQVLNHWLSIKEEVICTDHYHLIKWF